MQDLIRQERFELEVLDRLNSKKLLKDLVFCGGTMLRLCFGLNRFSVDLDFWIMKEINMDKLFRDFKGCLSQCYELRDAANKFHTILFEVRSKDYPRCLKIEIRKKPKTIKTEQAIAYSPHSNRQVILRVVSLPEMMQAKIAAFLERKEIRDVYDMEFLLKKGIRIDASDQTLKKIVKTIESFTQKDYTVKLGSLLEEGQRKYYISEHFKVIQSFASLVSDRLQCLPDDNRHKEQTPNPI